MKKFFLLLQKSKKILANVYDFDKRLIYKYFIFNYL